MHSTLFTLPGGIVIQSYGFCLAVAFLSGIVLAWRRAKLVKADPRVVLEVSVLAMVFGVGGARLLFVLHYWGRFANKPNLFLAVLDVRQGGLEFLGGFIAATLAIAAYLVIAKRWSSRGKDRPPFSISLYLDILTPSLMWGLAITRIGCFLNGCCFGGVCVVPGTQDPACPWAMRFPYGSPPFVRQWEEQQIEVPDELVVTTKTRSFLIPRSDLFALYDSKSSGEAREVHKEGRFEDLTPASPSAPTGHPEAAPREESHKGMPRYLERKLQQPSRENASRTVSLSELRALASTSTSLPIHPTQLYASINAALLWLVLAALFRLRKRHGVVFAAVLILYPPTRFILEAIRADNPRDTLGMTISQFASVTLFIVGLVTLVLLYTKFRGGSVHPAAGMPSATGQSPASQRRRQRARKKKPRGQRA